MEYHFYLTLTHFRKYGRNKYMKRYIVSDPDILSGKPVIKGTRIPIARILFLLKEGYTVEAIHEDYPHVKVDTIEGAMLELVDILDSRDNASKIL